MSLNALTPHRAWLPITLLLSTSARIAATPRGAADSTDFIERPSSAQRATMLEIQRAPGSEECPDVERVFDAVGRMFPDRAIRQTNSPGQAAARASVHIYPTTGGHEAIVTMTAPRPGERVLIDNDAHCSGLADALAVCLVMLMDLGVQQDKPVPQTQRAAVCDSPECPPPRRQNPERSPERPHVGHPAPSSPRIPMKPVDAAASRTPPWHVDASAAAVGGVGLLKPPGLGVAFGLELFYRERWGMSIQALRFWAERLDAEGGSLTLTLWGGMTDLYFRQRLGSASLLDVSLRFGAGSQKADADGYATNLDPRVLWLVAGPNVRYLHRFTPFLGAFAGVGVLGQLWPQKFSVGKDDGAVGRRTVAEPATLGLITQLGLSFGG